MIVSLFQVVLDIAILTGWSVAKLLASGIYSIISRLWNHSPQVSQEELYTKILEKLDKIENKEARENK